MRRYTTRWAICSDEKAYVIQGWEITDNLTLLAVFNLVPDSSEEDIDGIACLEVGQRYCYDDIGNCVERTA